MPLRKRTTRSEVQSTSALPSTEAEVCSSSSMKPSCWPPFHINLALVVAVFPMSMMSRTFHFLNHSLSLRSVPERQTCVTCGSGESIRRVGLLTSVLQMWRLAPNLMRDRGEGQQDPLMPSLTRRDAIRSAHAYRGARIPKPALPRRDERFTRMRHYTRVTCVRFACDEVLPR